MTCLLLSVLLGCRGYFMSKVSIRYTQLCLDLLKYSNWTIWSIIVVYVSLFGQSRQSHTVTFRCCCLENNKIMSQLAGMNSWRVFILWTDLSWTKHPRALEKTTFLSDCMILKCFLFQHFVWFTLSCTLNALTAFSTTVWVTFVITWRTVSTKKIFNSSYYCP